MGLLTAMLYGGGRRSATITPTQVDVITIEGQSNALGIGLTADLVNTPYNLIEGTLLAAFGRVKIFNLATMQYENLHIGVNNMSAWDGAYVHSGATPWPDPTFGPELFIAYKYIVDNPTGTLYINKFTGDGQPISYFQKGQPYYTTMQVAFTAADNQLSGCTINRKGWMWVQGEGNYTDSAASYETALTQIINDRLSDGFITTSTRKVITQIDTTNGDYGAGVATAKDNVIAAYLPNAGSVTYTNNKRVADTVHLNYKGQQLLSYGAMDFIYGPIAYYELHLGQSNEQGGNLSPLTDLPLSWQGVQDNIYMWYTGDFSTGEQPGIFQKMQPNVNTSGEASGNGYANTYGSVWSVEQALSHDIQEYTGGKVFVHKVVHGGLDISHWQAGGDMRARMDLQIPAAIQWLTDNGYQIQPVLTRWGQGEANAGEATAIYQPKLEEVIAHVRTYFPNCPVLMQKLGASQTSVAAGRATINQAFDNIKQNDPLTDVFNPDSTAMVSDGIHWNTAALLIAGHESFNIALTNEWI